MSMLKDGWELERRGRIPTFDRLGCNKGLILPLLRLRSYLTKLATITLNPGPGSFPLNLRVYLVSKDFSRLLALAPHYFIIAARHWSVHPGLDFQEVFFACRGLHSPVGLTVPFRSVRST